MPEKFKIPEDSPDDVLLLSQFKKAPYVSFDQVAPGQLCSAVIYVANPEDVKQTASICTCSWEKNKDFNGDISYDFLSNEKGEFAVEAGESFKLNFCWNPDKPGKIREVVEFKVIPDNRRQYTVRAYLLGECTAPKTKKKRSARDRPTRQPFAPRQPCDGSKTFSVQPGTSSAPVSSTFTVQPPPKSTASPEVDDGFLPATSIAARGLVSCQSPRRETFLVTKTNTYTQANKEVVSSPVKYRTAGGDEIFYTEEEVFTKEETVIEESKVEVCEFATIQKIVEQHIVTGQAEGIRRGRSRLRRSITYDVDICEAEGNATVFEQAPETPRNSTLLAPSSETITTNAMSLDSLLPSAIRPCRAPDSYTKVRRRPDSGDAPIELMEEQDVEFRKPAIPRSKSVEGSQKKCVKKLDYVSKLLSNSEETLKADIAIEFGGAADYSGKQREEWLKQEEVGFTAWLNAVLAADFDDDSDPSEEPLMLSEEAGRRLVKKLLAEGTVKPAPSKETVSLNLYSTVRNLNELRGRANQLWDQLKPLVEKVDVAATDRKFYIREDVMVHSDVGLQRRVLEILSGFNPLWLRIGLETVFQETIHVDSARDRISLLRFVVHRLFNDPETQRKYAHATVKTLFLSDVRSKEMGQLFLKRFVFLLVFLDKAKTVGIMKHNPCLFLASKKKSAIKSIREVFNVFVKDFLSGHGNLFKFLSRNGYKPLYEQKPLDEYRYCVKNLSVDLRDGIILMRIVQLLTGNPKHSERLLFPPVDILRKVHNMQEVFADLETASDIELKDITPKQIVEGNRNKTLEFLWRLVLYFQIKVLFDKKQVEKEINRLTKSLSSNQAKKLLDRPIPQFECMEISLLFQWIRLVCCTKNLQIRNFRGFEDGKALCCLLSYYHPNVLPKEFHIEAECNIWECFFKGIKEIGGVPDMLSCPEEGEGCGLDERVTILYLTMLCGRLIEVQRETNAAQTIQSCWRRRKFRMIVFKAVELCKKVQIIQNWWRKKFAIRKSAAKQIAEWYKSILLVRSQRAQYLMLREEKRKREAAALVIQKYWRKTGRFMVFWTKVKVQLYLIKKATLIQAAWRSYKVRKDVAHMHSSATTLASFVRMYRQRRRYLGIKKASVCIAEKWKATLLMWEQRKLFLSLLQEHRRKTALWRGRRVRMELAKRRLAARKILTFFRMCVERRNFQKQQAACLKLQSWLRMVSARRQYLIARDERRLFLMRTSASVRIQAWYRMTKVRKAYIVGKEEMRLVAIRQRIETLKAKKIQRWYREIVLERERFRMQENCAARIQTWWRMAYARKMFLTKKRWAVRLQSCFRGSVTRKAYLVQRVAAVKIQKIWRGYHVRTQTRCMKILHARQRIVYVNSRATENQQLGERRKRSFDYILKWKELTKIYHHLSELEVTTRLSRESCIAVAREGGANVLVKLCNQMGQSLADAQVSAVIVKILLNFAKDETSAECLMEQDHWLETIIRKMMIYDPSKLSRPMMKGDEEETLFVRLGLILICVSHSAQAQFAINRIDTARKKLKQFEERLGEEQNKKQNHHQKSVITAKSDRLAINREQKNVELLEVRVENMSRSPFTPYWVLEKEKPSENDISPLQVVKIITKRYGI